MKISCFKTEAARALTEDWIDAGIGRSRLSYQKHDVQTAFGRTRVLSVNHAQQHLEPLVYVPGARTCGIFLDLSDRLHTLATDHRIYLLDVVGQVGMSDRNCPSLKDGSYGLWLNEVRQALELEHATYVGASFGGQIVMKFAAVAPKAIKKIVLLNPIGFSNINFAPASLYRTLAPVIAPNRKNVDKFLSSIVFASNDGIDAKTKEQVGDFVENAVRNFKFAGEYPSRMPDAEIKAVTSEVHLVVGQHDGLIPHQKTLQRAKSLLPNLKSVHVCAEQAHGIEVSNEAIEHLRRILDQY